jgi:hypothetical protein
MAWRSKLKFSLLLVCPLLLGSCAKDLPGGASGQYTQLTFSFTTAGPINPNYIYFVAIRVLTPPVGTYNTLLTDPSQGPIPVIATGSKNGIVANLPTHYVIYTEATPNLYQCYRFPTSLEEPAPNDTAPINLAYPGQYVGDVYPGGIDPRPITTGNVNYGQQLGFTIDTHYLNQLAGTTPISVIQFNILTMNMTALTSTNGRVMDAIGNTSNPAGVTFNNPIQVNLNTSGTYTDQSVSPPVPETSGDTYPPGSSLPAVDLTSWSLTVTPSS